MEEDKSNQKLKVLEAEKNQISILRSGNLKAILATLQEIRTKGRISILPEIFELMLISDDEVVNSCHALLCDLKNVEAVPILVNALEEKKYESIRHLLVSACWQNGLDFHEDILVFADLVLKTDYLTAIEAFTVIENSIGELDEKALLTLTSKLQRGLASCGEQKKALINELIGVIKSF